MIRRSCLYMRALLASGKYKCCSQIAIRSRLQRAKRTDALNSGSGRLADKNEAAGAADAAAWAGDKCSGGEADKLRVTGGTCDPTTPDDAGGTPAPQLLRNHHCPLHSLG